MENLFPVKVFVLHVKKGLGIRRKSIETQMRQNSIEFEYMLNGDIDELNEAILGKYFTGSFLIPSPASSCAYKHLLVYEKMIKEGIEEAIVFEDDILLYKNFIKSMNQVLKEVKRRSEIDKSSLLVSLEDYDSKMVPRSEQISGQLLYKKLSGRCAGAYYLTMASANQILNFTMQTKADTSIDWQHNKMIAANKLSCYWCHPAIAQQGSHNGKFHSTLDHKRGGILRQTNWHVKRWLKSIVNFFN